MASKEPQPSTAWGSLVVSSWEFPLSHSTTMIDASGIITEASCTTCDPRPESEIWRALKKNGFEHQEVVKAVIPGPVLRKLSKRFADDAKLRFYKLTIYDKSWPGGIISTQWMALPEDTTKHQSVFSNPSWEQRRHPKWVEIQGMTPGQREEAVQDIILDTLAHFRAHFSSGKAGLDLVLEVFNWTALEYEEALRLTAKVLYRLFTQGKVRSCGRDHWEIEPKETEA